MADESASAGMADQAMTGPSYLAFGAFGAPVTEGSAGETPVKLGATPVENPFSSRPVQRPFFPGAEAVDGAAEALGRR